MKLLTTLVLLFMSAQLSGGITLEQFNTSEHFTLFCARSDQQISEALLEAAEKSFHQMACAFEHEHKDRLIINIYPDLNTFHAAIERPNAPDWVVGSYDHKTASISMVSPLNPGPRHTYDSLFGSLRYHIAIAFILDTFTSPLPSWLQIGIAMQQRDQDKSLQKQLPTLVKSPQIPPSLAQLEEPTFEFLANHNGFIWSYGFVIFLEQTYGWNKVMELATNYASFDSLLGISKEDFCKHVLRFFDEKKSF